MSDIAITTNGTIESTKLTIDGKDVTKKEKVTDISFYAEASWKGKFSGETYPGCASASYSTIDEEGKTQSHRFGTTDTKYKQSVGQKMTTEDSVIRYLGTGADTEVKDLADKIITHCDHSHIPCPSIDELLVRSADSLKDKAGDLGIKLEEDSSNDTN